MPGAGGERLPFFGLRAWFRKLESQRGHSGSILP